MYCDECFGNCSSCQNDSMTCTQCIAGLYFHQNTCVDKCPKGFFEDGTNCTACQWKCLECSGAKWNCTECNPNAPAFYLNFRCHRNNCPVGYYGSVAMNYTCQPCSVNCSACSGDPGPCSSCNAGYYLFQQYCYVECPNNTHFEDDATRSCLDC